MHKHTADGNPEEVSSRRLGQKRNVLASRASRALCEKTIPRLTKRVEVLASWPCHALPRSWVRRQKRRKRDDREKSESLNAEFQNECVPTSSVEVGTPWRSKPPQISTGRWTFSNISASKKKSQYRRASDGARSQQLCKCSAVYLAAKTCA